jgi:hypothetical protein
MLGRAHTYVSYVSMLFVLQYKNVFASERRRRETHLKSPVSTYGVLHRHRYIDKRRVQNIENCCWAPSIVVENRDRVQYDRTVSCPTICCGTVTIFYGSGSGSTFEKLRFRFRILKSYGSGSGSYFWKVTVPVPVPAPYLQYKYRYQYSVVELQVHLS